MKKLLLFILIVIFLSSFVSAAEVSNEGLVGYWDMDNASQFDIIGDNNPIPSPSCAFNSNGALGNSTHCNLDGIVYNLSKINIPPGGNFTQVIWFNYTTLPVTPSGIGGIWTLGGDGAGAYGLDFNNSNIMYDRDIANEPITTNYGDSNSENTGSGFNTINPGTWYMVAVTYNGSFLTQSSSEGGTIQIDGNITVDLVINQNTGNFFIGKRNDGDVAQLRVAQFDEISLWNRTLTHDELKIIYGTGVPLPSANYTSAIPPTIDNLTVNITSPNNNNVTKNNLINFTYIPLSINSTIENCTLIINDSYILTNYTIINDTINQFTDISRTEGYYEWKVQCADSNEFINSSSFFLTIDNTEPIIDLGYNNGFNANGRTIIANQNNLTLNITFNDSTSLFQTTVNITCDINTSLHFWENLSVGIPYLEHFTTVNTTGMLYQICNVSVKASDKGINEKELNYNFYIGNNLRVNATNIYNNNTFGDFSIRLISGNNTLAPYDESFNIVYSGQVIGILPGNYNITFNKSVYFDNNITDINIDNNSNITYLTYQSLVNISVIDVIFGEQIFNFTTIITNQDDGHIRVINNSINDTSTFILNAGNYSVNITAFGFEQYNDEILVVPGWNTFIFELGFSAQFNLYDEDTWGIFDTEGVDIDFLLFCPNETITTPVLNYSQNITITCNYSKFKFFLDYGDDNYYRTFIIPPSELGEVDVYLIDLNTTRAIFNSFYVDDLYDQYDNIRISITKNSPNGTVQITEDYIDIENKVGAYLIENNEYELFVFSDNLPTRSLGSYGSDTAGAKHIKLYDINLGSDPSGFHSSVTWTTGIYNDTFAENTSYAYFIYNDTEDRTETLVWTLYQNEFSGTVIYNVSVNNPGNIQLTYNVTPYLGSKIYSIATINHPDLSWHDFGNIINAVETKTLQLLSAIPAGMANWVILIGLMIIAGYATVKSSNIIAMVICGIAGLLVMFGWFNLSKITLGFCTLIALISLLREKAQRALQ